MKTIHKNSSSKKDAPDGACPIEFYSFNTSSSCLFSFLVSYSQVSEEPYLEDGIPHVEMILEEKNLTGPNKQFIGKCRYDVAEESTPFQQ